MNEITHADDLQRNLELLKEAAATGSVSNRKALPQEQRLARVGQ